MVIEDMDTFSKHINPIIRLYEYSRRKTILRLFDEGNKIITDVGCEKGPIAKEVIDKCKKIYCLDIDPKLLKKAERNLNSEKAMFILSDAQKIPLEDDISDVTICTEVLEHLQSPMKCIKELKRITKKEGDIVISVPNEKFVLFIKKIIKSLRLGIFFKGIPLEKAENHLHIFNKKKILSLVNSEGLKVEKVFYHFPLFTTIFLKLKNTKK